MSKLILFVDTNVFLQCKPLAEITWAESFSADCIEILVGAAVQDEIDRLKIKGETRVGQRARSTNGLFRRALDRFPEALVLREAGPRVVLRLTEGIPSGSAVPEGLDRSRPDDRLIEEALAYQPESEGEIRFITGDTGPELRARRLGVAVFRVPVAWMLPPELDERDKRIRTLEQKINALEKSQPGLTLCVCDQDGGTVTAFRLDVQAYAPLSATELQELVAAVREAHPPKSKPLEAVPVGKEGGQLNKDNALTGALAVVTQVRRDQIARYNKDYTDWLTAASRKFERLHETLNVKARLFPFRLRLENRGSVPADELLVELSVDDGLGVSVADDDDEVPELVQRVMDLNEEVVLGLPPELQNPFDLESNLWRLGNLGFGTQAVSADDYLFSEISRISRPVFARDRHAFYVREGGDKLLAKISLECREFRHGAGAREILGWIVIPADVSVTNSRLHCRVSARNLVKAVSVHVPIELQFTARSTREVANRWRCEVSDEQGSRG